jgi:TRAP-type C4-dicarboxylate transport system permease small subunit
VSAARDGRRARLPSSLRRPCGPCVCSNYVDRIERILVACNRWLLILLLLAMACIVFANVVLRYTTGDSIVWAEEVARHMMIWVTFLGAGLVLRFGGHVAIDNLHQP